MPRPSSPISPTRLGAPLVAALLATSIAWAETRVVEPGSDWPGDLAPGDEIVFAAGQHDLRPIALPDNVTLTGQPGAVLSPATNGQTALIRTEFALTISGLRIEMRDSTGIAIDCHACSLDATDVEIIGGASAMNARDPRSIRMSGIFVEDQSAIALRILRAEGDVSLSQVTFVGERFNAGLHITPGNAPGTLVLDHLAGQGIGHESQWLGFISLVDTGLFESASLRNIRLAGPFSGIGLLIQSVRQADDFAEVSLGEIELANWQTAASIRSLNNSVLNINWHKGAITNNERGIILEGEGTAAKLDQVEVADSRTGMRVSREASISLIRANLSRNTVEDVAIESRANLDLRESIIEPLAAGIRIHNGAGNIDLGTEEADGANTFRMRATRTWAVTLEDDRALSAHGNRWYLNGLEVFGHVAINDLIANGSSDNPVAEAGQGTILLAPRSDVGSTRVRWDRSASRATPGYGNSVFRSEEEMLLRFDSLRLLELGPGEYAALPDSTTGLTVRGSGKGNTILVAPRDLTSPWIKGFGELELSGLTIRFPDGAPACAAIEWDGPARLESVVIENAPSSPVLVFPPGDDPIQLRDVQIITTAHARSSLVAANARSIDLHRVHLDGGPLEWIAPPPHRITGAGLQVTAPAETTTAIHLDGIVDLSGLVIDGAPESALVLMQSEDATRQRIKGYDISGFTQAGITIQGEQVDVVLEEGRLVAGASPDASPAGVMIEADGHINITGIDGKNLRPGVDVARLPEALVLRQIGLELEQAYNALARQDDGIRFRAPQRPIDENDDTPAEGTEPNGELVPTSRNPGIQLLRNAISGYDAAIHITPDHEDTTPILVGNRTGLGANYLGKNSVGLRIASASADVRVLENLGNSLVSENGVGVLIEAGMLRSSGFRIIGNQVGIVVRGGTVDLGGGPLNGGGRNLLWPQAGALAIVNETSDDVFAIGNAWGEAAPRIGTENEPVSGPVVTLRDRTP